MPPQSRLANRAAASVLWSLLRFGSDQVFNFIIFVAMASMGFNDAEKTWECPCHGSRFGTDGALLQGPAAEPLAPARAYLALAAAQ